MSDSGTSRFQLPLLPWWLRWGAVAVVVGFVFYTSILTTPPATVLDTRFEAAPLDKWRHFLAYAAVGSASAYALLGTDRPPTRAVALGFAGALLYGVGIEAVQWPMANRTGSVLDAYANAIGCLAVVPWYLLARYVTFVPLGRWGPFDTGSDQ